MKKYFCFGKKDFCDNIENCDECQFLDGSGVISSEKIDYIFSSLFGDDYDLSRLRELVQADREGRCVVMPCKVGDTVYEVKKTMCRKKILGVCDELCMGYYDGSCWVGDWLVKEGKFNFWMVDFYGKTIFLTCEAAESALKEREKR